MLQLPLLAVQYIYLCALNAKPYIFNKNNFSTSKCLHYISPAQKLIEIVSHTTN